MGLNCLPAWLWPNYGVKLHSQYKMLGVSKKAARVWPKQKVIIWGYMFGQSLRCLGVAKTEGHYMEFTLIADKGACVWSKRRALYGVYTDSQKSCQGVANIEGYFMKFTRIAIKMPGCGKNRRALYGAKPEGHYMEFTCIYY